MARRAFSRTTGRTGLAHAYTSVGQRIRAGELRAGYSPIMALPVNAQVTIAMTSGIPRDAVVNNFYFDMVNKADSDFAQITAAIQTFYSSITPQLSSLVNRTGNVIKYYDHGDLTPRVPRATQTFNLTGTVGSGALPAELAICLSFQADRESGVPQARRRGRVYIGPLSTPTNTNGLVTASHRDAIKNAAKVFLDASTANTNYVWVVHSHNSSTTDRPVTNGWVDDAFDIQRRRGLVPTSRATFVI